MNFPLAFRRTFLSRSILTLRILAILSLLSIVLSPNSLAQSGPGWMRPESLQLRVPATAIPEGPAAPDPGEDTNILFSAAGTTGNWADEITPEIQALSRGLFDHPVYIFNFVRTSIQYDNYYGSKKGAELTLLERSGNDFDQSALLVALLRAAGYQAQYVYGLIVVPYEQPYADLVNWWGLSPTAYSNRTLASLGYTMANFPSAQSEQDAKNFLLVHYTAAAAGWPIVAPMTGYKEVMMPRVWVRLYADSTYYWLDPAFKVHESLPPVEIKSLMGYSRTNFLSTVGGTVTADSVQSINYSNLSTQMTKFATNLLVGLRANYPNREPEEITGGLRQLGTSISALGEYWGMPLSPTELYGSTPVPLQIWDAIPTNQMASVEVRVGNLNSKLWLSQLQGRRLSLTFETNRAHLWLNDSLIAYETGTPTGSFTDVAISIDHPHIDRTYNTNGTVTEVDNHLNDQANTNRYFRTLTNATPRYALTYAFRASPEHLRQREQVLNDYIRNGLSSSSREIVTETLNIVGLNWLLQSERGERLVATGQNVINTSHHRFGRAGQEEGYFVDVDLIQDTSYARDGSDVSFAVFFDAGSFFSSAMEHGVIEQRQWGTNVGVSTVKALYLANQAGQRVFKATAANYTTVRNQLTNYPTSLLNQFQTIVNGGASLLLPANGQMTLNRWQGSGYVVNSADSIGMIISGNYFGGFGTFQSQVQPQPEATLITAQPDFFTKTPPAAQTVTSGDPVNMADGSFTSTHTDLSLGLAEPRGLNFERHYTSSRRHHNLVQLGFGWTHNFDIRVTETIDIRAGLGRSTAEELAVFLAAARVAADVYTNGSAAKDWTVTALVAQWAVDQLRRNAVSITMGAQTVQFIKQPDGGYTPPAGVTLTLIRTNGAYELRQRHGHTFRFGTNNLIKEIEDVHGKKLTFTHSAAGRLDLITDAYSRTLTFTYSNNLLRAVTDSTGRSAIFGHDAGLNLTQSTDPENKTRTYQYDANHQIIALQDADQRLISTNVYDSFGRVIEQRSEGDTNRVYKFFYGSSFTAQTDPSGDYTFFYFDEKSRAQGVRDMSGNLVWNVYDGQDHVIWRFSPLNELTTFLYDANHNLLSVTDPLGFTVTNRYDNLHRLTNSVDARGFASRFLYNSKHQITETRDPLGNRVTNTYNADGTLATRTDPGTNTVSFLYDSYGMLQRITYPGGDYETLDRNARGDVLVKRNTRGIFTTNAYNLRRQLTSSATVSNVVAHLAFDNSGNPIAATDARSFTTTNNWNGIGKLLTTTHPTTPAGSAVTRYTYNSSDWLRAVVNPLGHSNRFFYYANGWLLNTIDPLQRARSFSYLANGLKETEADALNRTNKYAYNARGDLVSATPPGESVARGNAFDPNGNRIAVTNLLNRRTAFVYDAANRLTTNTTHLGRETAFTYDPRGVVRTVREPSGQMTTNSYDARGRLTNRVDAAGSVAYSYDAGDLLLTVKEGTRTLTRTYDSLGRLETFTDGNTNLLRYNYDASGNLTRLQYPDGKAVTYSFDGRNQLTNVTDWAGRKTALIYDLVGRVTQVIRPNQTKRIVTYDVAGQTTRIEERDGANRLIALFRYGYDAAGEITNRFVVPIPQTNSLPKQVATHDADNRLATFSTNSGGASPLTVTHDTDGNLTSGPITNRTANTYTWDARNRLKGAGGLTYNYDAEGNRIAITNGAAVTRFVVNPAPALSQVLVRTKPDGSQTLYVYGLGLLYEAATNGTARTYHYDYLGNTVAMTDDSGNVTDRAEFDPYGNLTYRAGTNDTPFLFNGRYGVMTDANGLLQMRARYYNPYLCRFVSEDPMGFSGGMNFYAYANGNPVSLLDPFGFGATGEVQASSWLSAKGLGVPAGGYMDPFGNIHPTFCLSCHDNTPEAKFHKNQAVLANMLDWKVLAYQEVLGAVLTLGAGTVAESLVMAPELAVLRQTTPQYYIENGVRRVVASREQQLSEIPAIIYQEGQPPVNTTLRLDQLHSPKSEIPLDSRFLNIQPPIRNPVEVQPLGVPGQMPTVPVNQIKIVPPRGG